MNKKSTKQALLTSVVSLLLCISMLVGTTFAWFTDSVTSGMNQIVAGNLDVEVYYGDPEDENKIDGVETLFNDVTLWEPGAVAYENITVANVGTLDLKYQMQVNFGNENTVNGHGLSEILKVAVVENGIADDTERTDLTTDADLAWMSMKSFAMSGTLLDGESKTYGVVIWWEPSPEDNDWNVNNGKTTSDGEDHLHIDLGIKVVATQYTSETDSFDDQYDAAAPWTGEADTSWYKEGETTFTLTTAADLAGLAEIVNSGKDTFSGKTVQLGADIDLGNTLWTPIGIDGNGWNSKFDGTFIGTGYTISNLNAVGTSGVGLFGYVGDSAHIEGVTIDGAYVSGNDYVGAVMGSGYLAANCLVNNTVKNATVIATPYMLADGTFDGGAKAGAVAGYAINGNVTGNKAINCTVIAYRDLGGIVGMISGEDRAVTVSENTIENVTLSYVGVMGDYAEGKKNVNMGDFAGRTSNATIAENNEGEANKEEIGAVVIYNVEDLYSFAASVNAGTTYKDKIVLLGADIDLENKAWTPIGNSTNKFQGTFDGQNHTISNLNVNMPGKSNVGLFGYTVNGEVKNLTVENATIVGRLNVGVVAGTPYTTDYSNITVKGHVEVDGMSYVGGVGGKNAYADWNNVTVDVDETSYVKANSIENGTAYRTYVGGVIGFMGEGTHTVSNVTSNINVIGTTCDVGGIVGIAHEGNNFSNITCTGDVTITNAESAGDAEEIGGIAGVWMNSGRNVTFIDCSYTGTLTANVTEGVDLSDNRIVGKGYRATTSNELIIGKGASTEETLAEALATGGNVILTADIEVSEEIKIPEGTATVLNLNGKEITAGYQEGSTSKHIYPINNSGNLTIEGGTITGRGVYNQNGATLTVNGAEIIAQDYNGGACIWSYGTGEVYLNNAKLTGYTGVVSSEGYVEINGGTYTCYSGIAEDGTQVTAPTYNIRAYNGLKITDGTFTSRHGVISVGGGDAVIQGGSYTLAFASATTSNVVYVYGDTDMTIYGGDFISDNTSGKADSGAAVVVSGSNASVNIYGGTYVGMNGMVSGNATIYAGSFNTVWDYNHYAKLESLLAEGCNATQDENGAWIVAGTQTTDTTKIAETLGQGGSVIMTGDVKTEAETTAPYGNKVGFVQNGGVLDGNGNTLSVECYGDDYGVMTSGGVIKNLTIDSGCRAIMIMSPTQDIVIDNVYVCGDILYPINTGEHATVEGVDLIVSNSTFGGWSSFAGIESASFTNCDFINGGYGYGWPYDCLVKPYINTVFTDCDFAGGYYIDLSALENGCKVTLKNCTVDGIALTAENFTQYIVAEKDYENGSSKLIVELRNGTYMTASNLADYIIFE